MSGRLSIQAARLFDGERLLDEPYELRVEQGRISGLVPLDEHQEQSQIKDLTILPGLVDAHVHLSFDAAPDITALVLSDTPAAAALRAVLNARRQLLAGVTTVRDLGSRDGIVVDVARLSESDLLPDAPRIIAAGQVLTITGGHGYFIGREVDGPDEVRKGARAEIKRGAQVLKLMATGGVITRQGTPGATAMTVDELRAAVEVAHNVGLRVAAHAHGTEGIKNAIRAGVDTIEHVSYLDDEAIELFLTHDVWMVSTLVASERLMPHLDDPAMPAHVRDKIRDHTWHEAASLERAIKAGIRIAAGTDAGTGYNPHGGLAEQIGLLHRHGMDTRQALSAATTASAEAIGLAASAGRIAAGYPADVIVIRGNPLVDLAALSDIQAVYRAGRQVYPAGGDR